MISFPDGFTHLIERSKHVEYNPPNDQAQPWLLPEPRWLEKQMKDRIRIDLVPVPLLAQTYEFTFPVLIPSQLPSYNLWTVSLCAEDRTVTGDKVAAPCTTIHDKSVRVTFPIPGFHFGDRPEGWIATVTASSPGARLVGAMACLLLLWPGVP